jgi:predicted DNA-binding protein
MYKPKDKNKVEVFVTVEMKEQLRAFAKKSGITMSEVIKRMLEEYLK